MRGGNQFEDPLSMDMFKHLSSILIPKCLERGVEISRDFLRLRGQAAYFVDKEEVERRLQDVMIRLSSLRGLVDRNEVDSEEALTILGQLESVFTDLSEEMQAFGAASSLTSHSHSSDGSGSSTSLQLEKVRNLGLVRRVLDELLEELKVDPV